MKIRNNNDWYGHWWCKTTTIFIFNKVIFYIHWHIGHNDACIHSGFRIRHLEVFGIPLRIPFIKYDNA